MVEQSVKNKIVVEQNFMFFRAKIHSINLTHRSFPIYALMTPFRRSFELVVVVVVVVVAVVVVVVDFDLTSATLKHFIIERKRKNLNIVKTLIGCSLLTFIVKTFFALPCSFCLNFVGAEIQTKVVNITL